MKEIKYFKSYPGIIFSGISKFLIILALLFVGWSEVQAQDEEKVNDGKPKVYIDCNSCDYNHIRREVTFVSYVRDPNLADVHVFITQEGTSRGGRQYEFTFIGKEDFSGTEYTFVHNVDRNASSAERRESLNDVIELGLSPFVIQTSKPSLFSLEYEGFDEGKSAEGEIEDPWNYWVFEIYAGSLRLNLESNKRNFDSRWGLYADRVTEEWKVRIRPYFNYEYVEIDREEQNEPVISRRHRHGVNTYAIKSLGQHWSAGVFGDYLTRNDRNFRHRFRFMPGLEYNIFPYEEATRKSLTVAYQIGYTYSDYYEETLFGVKSESLLNQELSASVRIEQPWGNIRSGIEASHYFHDFTYRSAEMFGDVSVRLTKGLSLNFFGRFEVIQDQISLPAGDTSLEDILLDQRELATDFSFYGAISLSYTFGSDFANVVNTRF